jgi:hypothetical protein
MTPHFILRLVGFALLCAALIAPIPVRADDCYVWAPLHNGTDDGQVEELIVYNDLLHIGGGFTMINGNSSMRHIARWNAGIWEPVGSGRGQNVAALGVYDDGGGEDLYAGAYDHPSPGGDVCRLYNWNGSSWTKIADFTAPDDPVVVALGEWTGAPTPGLVVGGAYNQVLNWSPVAGYNLTSLAVYNPTMTPPWQAIGGAVEEGGSPGEVLVIKEHNNELYIGGRFDTVGGVSAAGIAKWDGAMWHSLGLENTATWFAMVWDIAFYDPDGPDGPASEALYVAGLFDFANPVYGVPPDIILVRSSGGSWGRVGGGFYNQMGDDPPVFDVEYGGFALTVDETDPNNPNLYFGGQFDYRADDESVLFSNIARWDGSAWHTVAGGVGGLGSFGILDLAVADLDGAGPDDPTVVAGGLFEHAGPLTVNNFAYLTPVAPVNVLAHPANQSVKVSRDAVFTVGASGYGTLFYQWYKDDVAVVDDDHFSGAQTDTLTVTGCGLAHEGVYKAEVSNVCGPEESNTATLTVLIPDFDDDGDVDLSDYGIFLDCYNGPGNPPAEPGCDNADFDNDGDVDLSDYGVFLDCYNGPANPPAC